MKRKLIALFAIGCVCISGCSKSDNKNTPTETIEIYDASDVVNVHGTLKENGFSLKKLQIYTEEGEVVTGDKLNWTGTSKAAHIKGNKIVYDKVGRALFIGEYGGYEYKVGVSVNKDEKSRYLYKEIKVENDEADFLYKDTISTKVLFDRTTNSITLDATAGGTVRVDYPIDEGFGYDYTIEADFNFLQANNSTRYAGMMFRTDRFKNTSWYQMDVRKDIRIDSGVECTESIDSGSYHYPQRTGYANALPTDRDVKLRVEVLGMTAKFFIDGNLVIDTIINNVKEGNIGFQVNEGKVRFSNIKIYTGTSNITHAKMGTGTFVEKVPTNPTIISVSPSYESTQQIQQAMNNNEISAFTFKAELEDGKLVAKSLGGKKALDVYPALLHFGKVLIPNIIVENKDVAKKLGNLMSSIGADDATILSKDTEILKEFRKYNSTARLAYISSDTITNYQEASATCFKAGEANANIICFDVNKINKDVVYLVNARGYAAWAINENNDDMLAPYKATLSGAKVFITTSQENALKALDSNVFTNSSLFTKPIITGHRGDGSNIYYPENSLESFVWAANKGAVAIEIDIHTTKDNQLAIIHDGTTTAMTNCQLTVKDSTMEQLRSCKLKKGGTVTNYTIPTFNEVMEEFKDKETIFVVEIKDNSISSAKLMLEIAKQYNMMDRIVVIDFGATSLNYIKRNAPGLAVGYLNTNNVKDAATYAKTNNQYYNKCIGLSPNMGCLSTLGIQMSNARGRNYWAWTFNDSSAAKLFEYISAGNLAFTTNSVYSSTNWKIRLDSEKTTYELTNGSALNIKASTTNYVNKTAEETNYKIKVVSGSEFINVNNQTITKKAVGTAYVVLQYTTTLTAGNGGTTTKTFDIYSDLIRIDVK